MISGSLWVIPPLVDFKRSQICYNDHFNLFTVLDLGISVNPAQDRIIFKSSYPSLDSMISKKFPYEVPQCGNFSSVITISSS